MKDSSQWWNSVEKECCTIYFAHPPDVHELLGANIVGVDDEAAVVLVQQAAKLGIILQLQKTMLRMMKCKHDLVPISANLRQIVQYSKHCNTLYISM